MADTEKSQHPNATRKSKRKAAMKVREELTDESKDDGEDTDNNKEDKEAQKSNSSPRNTNSPDPNCAICLCKLENKSFTDSCFHMFCFVCLLEWSKIKAECPLCKQPFKSIIHNVRSYDDYDQYHLERTDNPFSFEAPSGRRFRYRTTVTQDYVFGVRPSRHGSRLPGLTSRHQPSRHPSSTSEFRRRIYINGMNVVAVRDSCRRSRNIAPVFFTSNPAASHRLVPWLNRELNALLYNHEEHVQFVLELIIDLIKRFPIQSEDFYQHVFPFVGRHTRHFMHEFEAFAKSPFCISSYDQKAVYEQQAEPISDSDSASSDDGNDSDVMIVSPSSAPPDSNRRRDPGAPRHLRLIPDMTPYSVSLRDLLEDVNEPSQSGWDSPIPGPSWHLSNLPSSSTTSLQFPGTSMQQSTHSRKQPRTSRVGADANEECEAEVVWSGSDSGDEVLCVGYDKPWQERTPVLVSTDSEEEKIAKRALKAKKKEMLKREESKSRRRSPSHSRHRRRSSSSSQSIRKRSRSRSRSRHQRSRCHMSKSPSRHDHRRRSPSPSGSKHRRWDRSVAYEDAFGYSRRTICSPETNSSCSKRSKHSESKSKRGKGHSQNSRCSSRSPSKTSHRRRSSTKDSRDRRISRTRNSSTETVSRHRHKKSKKHRRSRESDKDQPNSDVQYKIVKDKRGNRKGDPLMSITIKRDKSEDTHVVSSTVDSTNSAHMEIGMPDNVVVRTEPVSPPPRHLEHDVIPSGTIEQEPNTLSEKPNGSRKTKSSDSSSKNMSDSDSPADTQTIRKKSFKKHPSGHKNSRRPLPRIPDPLPSTLSGCTSPQAMPVLDVMSQFFPQFSSPSVCPTALSQGFPLPDMMANYMDSRHFYLYGFPGPCLPDFPSMLPQQPSSAGVTSSEHTVVVSSGEDSDVVVESVSSPSRYEVCSSMIDPGLNQLRNLGILGKIPGVIDDIISPGSIDISEEIDVEDSDNLTEEGGSTSPVHAVTEVLDSDDEPEKACHLGESGEVDFVKCSGSNVQDLGNPDIAKEARHAITELRKPPFSEPTTSTNQSEGPRKSYMDSTTDESMDIDVGGPELCSRTIEFSVQAASVTGIYEAELEESMEIDVVGSDDSKNSVHAIEEPVSSLNYVTCIPLHNIEQDHLSMPQSDLMPSMASDHVSAHTNPSGSVRGTASITASPSISSECSQTSPQSGQDTTADPVKGLSNFENSPKPNIPEYGAVLGPVIEGASQISSEEEEEEGEYTSDHTSRVIADVSDISSDESDYNSFSSPLHPLYCSTRPQFIDDDSDSSGPAGFSNPQDAIRTTISISDVPSDGDSEEEDDTENDDSNSLTRSGDSLLSPAVMCPQPSCSVDPTPRSPELATRSPERASKEAVPSADIASRSSGELSSGELSEDSSNGQKVYDDISSSEDFDSPAGPSLAPPDSSSRCPLSTSAAEQERNQDSSLSEGEIVSD